MEPTSGPRGVEHGPLPMQSQETNTNTSPEQQEVQSAAAQETAPASREAVNQNPGMTLPPVAQEDPVVTPQPIQQPVQTQPAPTIRTDSPVVANDIDVIEKEWVNKAKTIIHQTKDDPYQQEKEVSKLQADYLQKRYGKVVKPSED